MNICCACQIIGSLKSSWTLVTVPDVVRMVPSYIRCNEYQDRIFMAQSRFYLYSLSRVYPYIPIYLSGSLVKGRYARMFSNGRVWTVPKLDGISGAPIYLCSLKQFGANPDWQRWACPTGVSWSGLFRLTEQEEARKCLPNLVPFLARRQELPIVWCVSSCSVWSKATLFFDFRSTLRCSFCPDRENCVFMFLRLLYVCTSTFGAASFKEPVAEVLDISFIISSL